MFDLRATVDDVRQVVAYEGLWELTRLRQSDIGDQYYIVDANGLNLDIEGIAVGLNFRVDVSNLQPQIHSLTPPLTNETWRLLVTPVKGGTLILGISSSQDITDVDDRLQVNAKRFGASLESAIRVRPSDIDRNVYYAVLDNHARLIFAIGGIPLRFVEYPELPLNEVAEIDCGRSRSYVLLSVPFVNASGKDIGTLTAVEELARRPWFALGTWLVSLASSLTLASVGTLIGVRYISDEFRPKELLAEALRKGESPTIEFKESLR